jgi:hypothetical protein
VEKNYGKDLKTKQVLFFLLIYQLDLNKQDSEIKAIA